MRASIYPTVMTVSVDGGTPIAIDTDNGGREEFNMNWPGIDVRFMAWIKVPDITLDAGSHTLSFGLSERESYSNYTHGGIDAINIENFGWGPAGSNQPSIETPTGAADEWFAFTPADPPELGESVFDLSDLVEAPAGTHGALKRDGLCASSCARVLQAPRLLRASASLAWSRR